MYKTASKRRSPLRRRVVKTTERRVNRPRTATAIAPEIRKKLMELQSQYRAARPRHIGDPSPEAMLSTYDADAFTDDGKTLAIVDQFSAYPPRAVEWLWPGRLPLGMYSLLTAEEGSGKTFMVLDWAARISRGEDWPECSGSGRQGEVLYISAEDHPSYTLVPRAMAAKADLSRLYFLACIKDGKGGMATLDPQKNVLGLDVWLKAHKDCHMVVLDPITAFMGEEDQNTNSGVRRALDNLVTLARRHNVCILGVTHQNKSKDQNPKRKVLGSTAFSALARSVLRADSKEYGVGEGWLKHDKCNIAATATAIAYRIESTDIEIEGKTVPIGCIQWGGPETSENHSGGKCAAWLLALLEERGPMWRKTIDAAGKLSRPHKWSHDQINRAKKQNGIKSAISLKGATGGVVWYLPHQEEEAKKLAEQGR
jgi:putative DNA primase/helicase